MIRVLVDSSADLPEHAASSGAIDVLPIHVRFGSALVADDGPAGRAEFWDRLSARGPLPEIVAPPAGAFAESMSKMADEGAAGVLVVTPSRRVSGSHEAAIMAADTVRTRIPVRVVESKTVSAAYGIVAQAAAIAATAGSDLEATVRSASAEVGRSTTLIVVDTVEFLRRARRMGRAQSSLARILDLKPVFEVKDGVLAAAGVVRGRQRGRALLTTRASAHRTSGEMTIVHAEATGLASFVDRVSAVVGRAVVTAELGPTIACHTGPGAVGLVYGRS